MNRVKGTPGYIKPKSERSFFRKFAGVAIGFAIFCSGVATVHDMVRPDVYSMPKPIAIHQEVRIEEFHEHDRERMSMSNAVDKDYMKNNVHFKNLKGIFEDDEELEKVLRNLADAKRRPAIEEGGRTPNTPETDAMKMIRMVQAGASNIGKEPQQPAAQPQQQTPVQMPERQRTAAELAEERVRALTERKEAEKQQELERQRQAEIEKEKILQMKKEEQTQVSPSTPKLQAGAMMF
ncbi:MAG: hypothetical protein FWD89_01320 [Firmicutes bacterium]|nr:hypothetical protein [Bacillota bacterium]